MKQITAHGELAALGEDRRLEIFDGQCLIDGCDVWPAYGVALASASGWLDDAKNIDDLIEAVQHGAGLLDAEIVDAASLETETQNVIAAVIEWGDKVTAAETE